MADYALIKMLIQEPDEEPQILEFQQKMIKIGRGARKGVDVQLQDKSVARMHAVINVKGENATVMDMGGSKTLLDGKKVKARDKLTQGCELTVGNVTISIYVGPEAEHIDPMREAGYIDVDPNFDQVTQQAELAAADASGTLVEDVSLYDMPGSEQFQQQTSGTLLQGSPMQGELPPSRAEQAQAGPPAMGPTTPPPASHAPLAQQEGMGQTGTFESQHTGGTDSWGHPTESNQTFAAGGDFAQQSSGSFETYAAQQGQPGLYPTHQTAAQTVYGFYGPGAPPLPEQYAPSLAMLLEIADRLGKEVWYEQEQLW